MQSSQKAIVITYNDDGANSVVAVITGDRSYENVHKICMEEAEGWEVGEIELIKETSDHITDWDYLLRPVIDGMEDSYPFIIHSIKTR